LRWTAIGARAGFGFHLRQGGFEFVGRQTAPGVAAKLAAKQALGFVVFDIKIAALAAKAVGGSQFLPAAGSVNGAAKPLRIHKSFHDQNRMAVALLPVGAEPVGDQTQGTRTQIGRSFVGQEQEPAIIDHQGKTTAALFFTPANPAVAPAQAA